MTIKSELFSCMSGNGAFWLRVFGRGLSFLGTCENPPLFSERYGYRRPLLCAFGWRMFWLPKRVESLTNCCGKLDRLRTGDRVRISGGSDAETNGVREIEAVDLD